MIPSYLIAFTIFITTTFSPNPVFYSSADLATNARVHAVGPDAAGQHWQPYHREGDRSMGQQQAQQCWQDFFHQEFPGTIYVLFYHIGADCMILFAGQTCLEIMQNREV